MEWATYDQSAAPMEDLQKLFDAYFRIFPWAELRKDAQGFDMGCGSGRWARFVAPRVGTLHCIDASPQALDVARRNLQSQPNCTFECASVDRTSIPAGSMDFGYSLGVLHHVPDTASAVRACVEKLKPGAPLLLYLYYRFDNRPVWFRSLWRASDLVRQVVSRAPYPMRLQLSRALALGVYWPLARTARTLERAGVDVASFPLAAYRNSSLYTMQTDSLDRFGTRLEQRFTRGEIRSMMTAAGLERIVIGEEFPFWCAVGRRAR